MKKKRQSTKGKRGEYKTKDFIAETLGQASSYLGIAIPILRWAKKHGCMAFRHGKIHCKEVEPWLENHRPDIRGKALPPKDEVQVLNLLEDLQKKRNANALFEGLYMKRSEVSSSWTQIGSTIRQVLLQELQDNLPPRLEGLRAPEMVPIMQETADKILALWRSGIGAKSSTKGKTS